MDDIADELRTWASGVLPDVRVVLGPPVAAPGQDRDHVSLNFLRMAVRPSPRGPRRPPLQVELHFLVSAVSARPEAELRMVGELLFAALALEDVEVDPGPVTTEEWRSLGAPPRPGFILRLPFQRELPEPRAPRVRGPLVVKTAKGGPLHGQVLGPGDVPLAGASVEIPALQLFTSSDSRGRFQFANVPLTPPPRLVIRARGGVQSFVAREAPGTPLTIHFQIEEG